MCNMGIMGGTFDPIHSGHLAMAEFAKAERGLDRVLFIPTGDPPHKRIHADAHTRGEMVKLAIRGRAGFALSDIEIRRTGVTYTVDTLKALRSIHEGAKFTYIVGSDTLMTIENWRAFPEVCAHLKEIAAYARDDVPLERVEECAGRLTARYGILVALSKRRVPAVSSTEVRSAVVHGQSLRAMTPDAVREYIESEGLYLDSLRESVGQGLSARRYAHTLEVEKTAVQLAKRFSASIPAARVAAILHDCAKDMNPAEMARFMEDAGVPMEREFTRLPQLMHAAAGEAVAKLRYGITDLDILNAVRYHTEGRVSMSTLEKIIYLADAIEPTRKPYPGLFAVREAAQRDLDRAVMLCAEHTLHYVRQRGYEPAKNTLALLRELKRET